MAYSLVVNGETHTVDMPDRDAAALGAPRHAGPEGHQVRLRHRPVRRLHGAARRRARPVVPDAGLGGRREAKVTTIEGLPRDGSHPLQRAWMELDVPQCGYCQAGQLMAASALLTRDAESDRRADRHGDERQRLPLRHLPADQGSHSSSRPTAGGGRSHEEHIKHRHSSIVGRSCR